MWKVLLFTFIISSTSLDSSPKASLNLFYNRFHPIISETFKSIKKCFEEKINLPKFGTKLVTKYLADRILNINVFCLLFLHFQ